MLITDRSLAAPYSVVLTETVIFAWPFCAPFGIVVVKEARPLESVRISGDTTTGRPKPMGARGATMADTVGAKQD